MMKRNSLSATEIVLGGSEKHVGSVMNRLRRDLLAPFLPLKLRQAPTLAEEVGYEPTQEPLKLHLAAMRGMLPGIPPCSPEEVERMAETVAEIMCRNGTQASLSAAPQVMQARLRVGAREALAALGWVVA